MKKMRIGKVIVVSLMVIVVVLGVGLYVGCDVSSPGGDNSSPQDTSPVVVSAFQLWWDYESNEFAADAKYKDKLLEVTGIIENFGTEILGRPYIVLVGGSFWGVQCIFDSGSEAQLAKLNRGQTVVVCGYCEGSMFGATVLLDDCYLP